ncbi:MAG: hypothetical protein JHC84_08175 [Solirubrobacteraceae bacterium]|nr:hypothetical protein [Solirubrobacteraceae bacterium]
MESSKARPLIAAATAAVIALTAAGTATAAAPVRSDVSDSFTSVGTSSLGPNWAVGSLPDAPGAPVVGSSRIAFPPAVRSSAHWVSKSFGGAQEAVLTKRSGGVIGVVACLRSPGANATGYALYGESTGALTLRKYTNGTATNLYTAYTGGGTFATNDKLGIVVTATSVEAWLRKGTGAWTLAHTVPDPAAASCSGAVGVIGQAPSGDDFVGGGLPAGTTPPPPPPPTLPEVAAYDADGFIDGVGVNTHFVYGSQTAYCANRPAILQRLLDLGVRHIRDGAARWSKLNECGSPTGPQALVNLAALGIKTQFVADALDNGSHTVAEALPFLDASGDNNDLLDAAEQIRAAGGLSAIEGPNETDRDLPTTWITWPNGARTNYSYPWRAPVRQYMEAFYPKAKTRLPGVDVVNTSFAAGADRNDAENAYLRYLDGGWDAKPTFDVGNTHSYVLDGPPETGLVKWIADVKAMGAPTDPYMATEVGYNNRPENNYGWTSERAASMYLLRMLLEQSAQGAKRTFIYELANTETTNNRQNGFGLVEWDGTPKDQYLALRRMLDKIKDPGATATPAYTPPKLRMTVTDAAGNADPRVRSRVWGKRDGSYVVALWQDGSVWDTATKTDVTPAARQVRLTLAGSPVVQTFRPAEPARLAEWPGAWQAASPDAGTTNRFSLGVPGDPLLVRVTPG